VPARPVLAGLAREGLPVSYIGIVSWARASYV
jgi:hypothetical protein